MSVQSQIDRIEQNVANTYAVLSALGADMPTEQNTDNLAETAGSAKAVLYSEQTLTEEQQTQARENIGASPLKKYGKLVVFGDSLGEGSNVPNYYSFVDALSDSGAFESVVKACKNSATIGPYEVGTIATGYDLCSQIERYAADIAEAEIVICEFGHNDLGAVLAGNVEMGSVSDAATATTVCGYTRKAINRILELNPYAKIHWVFFQCMDYQMLKDSCGDIDTADMALLFWATAMRVARECGCFLECPACYNPNLVSNDGMHPNREGQELIAKMILQRLFTTEQIGLLERPMILSGDIFALTDLSVDSTFANALRLAQAGVNLKIQATAQGFVLTGYCSVTSEYMLEFHILSIDGNGKPMLVLVDYVHDGTISARTHSLAGQQTTVAREYLYKAGTEKMGLTYGTGASNTGSTIDITAGSDLSHQVTAQAPYNVTSKTTALVAEVSDVGSTAVVVGITTAASGVKYFSQLTQYKSTYSAATVRLDLSDVTGQYYPIITTYSGSGTCKITNWYFEEEV